MGDRPMRVRGLPQWDEGRQSKKFKGDWNKLPHGWLDCPGFGREISFIVPSKVPLDETFNDFIDDPKKRYSFHQVPKNFKIRPTPDKEEVIRIGMVVDLTNTDRYYSPSEFKKQGVNRHLKIRCKGRDCVPDNEAVNTFVFEVERHIFNQKGMKGVLVHCTHGHNRTGYMIVHYLMRTHQASSVTEAIQRFSEARPPGIYKKDYIDSLYAFYHETKQGSIVCPSTPEWKRSSSDDFDLNAPINNEKQEDIVVTMISNDDVLGDKIPDEQELELRRICLSMFKGDKLHATRGHSQFPGSHPVSLDRLNLQLLKQRYYRATWKADGTRYMLLVLSSGCFLIDRNFKFRRVQMRFPYKNNRDVFHHITLLDGEMVIDTIKTPDQKEERVRRYLIYDLIAVNGFSIVDRPFCQRWELIENEVVKPRNYDRQTNKCYRYDLELFGVRRKGFWLLSTVEEQVKKFIPTLPHDADGLIFQGWDGPYESRTDPTLLKWKFPSMNSVDFLFEVGKDGGEYLYLNERGKRRLMDNHRVAFGDDFDPSSSYSGKIIECSWDPQKNVWVFMRVRVDKSTPNEFNTYVKIMKSIKDNITEKVLFDEIGEIISLPMYADRIRTEIKERQKKVKPSPAKCKVNPNHI